MKEVAKPHMIFFLPFFNSLRCICLLYLQNPTMMAPHTAAEPVVSQKKKRRPKEARSLTKTERINKKMAPNNTYDLMKKRKAKLVSSTDDNSGAVSLLASVPGWLKAETM